MKRKSQPVLCLGFNPLRPGQQSQLVYELFWHDLSQSGHGDETSYQMETAGDAFSLEGLASFLYILDGWEKRGAPFFPG